MGLLIGNILLIGPYIEQGDCKIMTLDRIILGQHANTDIGPGLFVSMPGANVSDPDTAHFGNLMFDSSGPHSSLKIIQNGHFTITCTRQAISPRGDTVGNRLFDSFLGYLSLEDILPANGQLSPGYANPWHPGAEAFRGKNIFTVDHDTGRPSSAAIVANSSTGVLGGLLNADFFLTPGSETDKARQGNYLDKGSFTIPINSPLPNGEIPKVALRFAVGTSSGHFHPWYADTKFTPGATSLQKGRWENIDPYASDDTRIVHMDSNWMRLKWGGLGHDKYSGMQEFLTWDRLLEFFGDDPENPLYHNPPSKERLLEAFGFADEAEARAKIDYHAKRFSQSITNSQGIVGLVPYTNATSVHVDGFMSPTHAGLRNPVDRTHNHNYIKQTGDGHNAIDDYNHINSDNTPYGVRILGSTDFSTIPGYESGRVGQEGSGGNLPNFKAEYSARAAARGMYAQETVDEYFPDSVLGGGAPNNTLHDSGKRDMYGWAGHPSEFFVNPFSNGNCTFYTHMQPPYLNPSTANLSWYTGGPDYSDDPEYYALTEPRSFNVPTFPSPTWPAYCGTYLPVSRLREDRLDGSPGGLLWPDRFPNEPGLWGPWQNYWRRVVESGYNGSTGNPIDAIENERLWKGLDAATGLIHQTVESNTMSPIWNETNESHFINGSGIKWPAGHYHAGYLDYRDWTGSMGLSGAGSKEAMASDDVWDTFYVSYFIYSTGSATPAPAARAMNSGTTTASPSSTNKVGAKSSTWIDGYYGGKEKGVGKFADVATEPTVINNFVFPDDLVGTVGVPDSDPFANNRDLSGKIFGNMHFDLYLDEGKIYGSDKFSSLYQKPEPAITLDFSGSKWNYANNNNSLSLAIHNSAWVIGAGGPGGDGMRRISSVSKSGDVSDAAYGGGGGGGGGGTGRNYSESYMTGAVGYKGAGLEGDGWARGSSLNFKSDLSYGKSGGLGNDFDAGGTGGHAAVYSTTDNIDETLELTNYTAYGHGGDGGDAFGVIHPIGLKPLISIKNSNTGIIVAGGGGGAGGYETAGADGGARGDHGEDTISSRTYRGGNPGYIISSVPTAYGANNTYTIDVFISNINDGIIKGRNPSTDSYDKANTSGGAAGAWVLTGNNTTNTSLAAAKMYSPSGNFTVKTVELPPPSSPTDPDPY